MKIIYVNEPAVKEQVELGLVKLATGFGCTELWYGETVVTEGQWSDVMGGQVDKGSKYPKVNVSFNDAVEFCEKLSQNSSQKFRLPTEVEQCRGLGGEPEDLDKYAVFDRKEICPVKSKLPNEFGLYDVRGLVWEWAETGEKYKSLRGGSWLNNLDFARAVFRYDNIPGVRYSSLGFRVVSEVRP